MKTIMLASHDMNMRDKQRDMLTQGGYLIVGDAENAEQTVDKFKELKPDLVILDVHLSKFDGIQALKSIKAIDSNALIIICTERTELSTSPKVIEAIKFGAMDWIDLVYTHEDLLSRVKKILK